MTTTIYVGAASLNQVPMDWQGNVSRIKQVISQAKSQQLRILCLPELCITGYGCEDWFLSDWVTEKATEIVSQLAAECTGIAVVLTIPMRYKGVLYNTAVVIDNARIVALVPKKILANTGVYYEPRWFTAWEHSHTEQINFCGEQVTFGQQIIEIAGVKCGVEVCEDAWHDTDRPAHFLAKQGVQLLLNTSASHFAFGKSAIRRELVRSSSKQFNCTYVYANLLGNESGRLLFDGELLIARKGAITQSTALNSFQDFVLIKTTLEEEKQEEYTPLSKFEELHTALPLALFDYMRKSKSKGFVLSLSGGADSSLCAVMVAEMVKRGVAELGIEKFIQKTSNNNLSTELSELTTQLLTCAYQATVNSGEATLQSAKELAAEIGAAFHEWTIDNNVQHPIAIMEKVLGRKLTWETDDLALQNLQARARAPYIWMLANIKQALLITTSNRSEGAVGYATMDGDTSGSIAPIADIDKDFILEWLQWAENTLGYYSLRFVNNMQPTAELRPKGSNQTDEKDLMPYTVLAKIEEQAIKYRKTPVEVFHQLKGLEEDNLLKTHIRKFYTMWARNQWKRERLAPSFHLDDFNLDPKTWCRFPILSSSFEEELKMLDNQ